MAQVQDPHVCEKSENGGVHCWHRTATTKSKKKNVLNVEMTCCWCGGTDSLEVQHGPFFDVNEILK